MGKLWSKWLPIILFLVGWTAAWVFLWQSYLFELFDREPRQGLTVFEVRSGDVRILWSAAVAGLDCSIHSTGEEPHSRTF